MPTLQISTLDGAQTGRAYLDVGNWKWINNSNDEAFVPGQWIIWRMSCDLPRGAVISSATLSVQFGWKNDATQQTEFLPYYEAATSAWPIVNDTIWGTGSDTAILPGKAPIPLGVGKQTISRVAGGPGTLYWTYDLVSTLQAIVDGPGYKPGAYFTIYTNTVSETGDMHFKTDSFTIPVTYTVPETEVRRSDVNVAIGQTIELDTSGWDGGNTAFGEYAITTPARDPALARSGAYSMSITKTEAAVDAKPFQVIAYVNHMAGETFMLAGWAYIPASVTALVQAGFLFIGGYRTITARDQWVEFCSDVYTTTGASQCYPQVRVAGGMVTGTKIWVDDLAIIRGTVRQPPFTGATADQFNSDYEFTSTATRGQSVRETKAKSHFHDGTALRARMGYVQRTDGLWVRSDPNRRNRTWDKQKTLGTTWDQLKSSGQTWDGLKGSS